MDLKSSSKIQKWIIDTDPGADDMMAILYLLGRKNNEVLLITTVDGNVSLEKVTINARKILKIAEKKHIEIAKGSEIPIIKLFPNETGYHFSDGLGDAEELKNINYHDVNISNHSGVIKIIELIKKYPNEINLLCLAPLTNIATAFMLYPEIVNLINRVYIMGGTSKSLGNQIPTAEFNVAYDFISAKIVFENFKNLIITPWEPTETLYYNLETMKNLKKHFEEKKIKYNKTLFDYSEKVMMNYDLRNHGIGSELCDLYSIIPHFNHKTIKKFYVADIDFAFDSHETVGTMIIKNKKQIRNKTFSEFICSDFAEGNIGNKKVFFDVMDREEVHNEFISIFTELL